MKTVEQKKRILYLAGFMQDVQVQTCKSSVNTLFNDLFKNCSG